MTATVPQTVDEPAFRRPDSAAKGMWFPAALTVFEIGASILVFHYARNHGASEARAYLWACLAPLVGVGIYFLRSRDLSGASIAILAFNAISAVVALVGHTDAKICSTRTASPPRSSA